jgi:acyl dehydratase
LDDFKAGEVFVSRPQTLTERHFTAFAGMTGDSHPIHYDRDYARSKGWEAPLAHGLMLLSICAMGAAPIGKELEESMVAMLGNDARYKRPVVMGDTVTPTFTVTSVEFKGSDRGILRMAIALHDQNNELVLEGTHIVMLRRRQLTLGTPE